MPGLKPPDDWNANVKRSASGKAAASCAARQSLGTTSKPTAGMTATPACRAASFWLAASSMTSISPVMSRYDARVQTGGNHRAPWPKRGLHSAARAHARQMFGRGIIERKDALGAVELRGQRFDRGGRTPGQDRAHAARRFFGNQAARIPVGSVNHPLVGSHLGGPFTDVASSRPITK